MHKRPKKSKAINKLVERELVAVHSTVAPQNPLQTASWLPSGLTVGIKCHARECETEFPVTQMRDTGGHPLDIVSLRKHNTVFSSRTADRSRKSIVLWH